jgi:hypothetical protein
MIIDGIEFDRYEVESVSLNLNSCKLTLKFIFIKGKKDVVRVKEFEHNTNCDVNINQVINEIISKL